MTTATDTRQEKKKRGETKQKSARPAYDIQIRAINSNTNPRNPLSASLQSQGWDCMTGDKKIWNLATSDDATERAMYVKLIQDFDQELASLAATILSQGLLEPIEVREGGTGTFCLVFGARRCLAVLFNWCLIGKPREPLIEAFLVKGNSTQLLHRAVIENIRKPQSVIDEAKAIRMALNNGETEQDVAEQLGMSHGTIRNRLALLELPPAVQHKIHAGKTSVKAAKEAHAESNGDASGDVAGSGASKSAIPTAPAKPPMRKRKEVEEAREEFPLASKERAIFDWMLGEREKIC